MSGPPRVPTAILEARGSWLAKARESSEPVDEVCAPEPPAILSGAALDEWNYIVPRLLKRRTLTESDRGLLVAMCLEWVEYVEAYTDLRKLKKSKKSFKGHLLDHPRVRIKGAFDRYSKAAIQFGLSPSAKSRVQAAQEQKQPDSKPQRRTLRIAQ